MRALIFGASGIVGQYMRASVPEAVEPLWFRREADDDHLGFDFDQPAAELHARLSQLSPDVIVNLAGENRVDVVEKRPDDFRGVNVTLPMKLAAWCNFKGAHYLHISTNGIFSGNEAPYGPESPRNPVNQYGKQKKEAEDLVMEFDRWTVARLTFIVGVRLTDACRRNPAEDMLRMPKQIQTIDRWFSPCFAPDAARALWQLAESTPNRRIYHIGLPISTTRYQIAEYLNLLNGSSNQIEAVDSSRFPEIAPRPLDTTWADGALPLVGGNPRDAFLVGLAKCYKLWSDQVSGRLSEVAKLSANKWTA